MTPSFPPELVEKIAKAIKASGLLEYDDSDTLRELATAALSTIEADLKERGLVVVPAIPTVAMVNAGHKRWRDGPDYTPRDAAQSTYRAMINQHTAGGETA